MNNEKYLQKSYLCIFILSILRRLQYLSTFRYPSERREWKERKSPGCIDSFADTAPRINSESTTTDLKGLLYTKPLTKNKEGELPHTKKWLDENLTIIE
ncbi:MAG: hypothetical protein QXP36_13305 [Conexivisphaerales archaeon]